MSLNKSFYSICLLTLMVVLSSCRKEDELHLCQSDDCLRYTAIWKSILMEENQMSEEWFDEHIQILQTQISAWNNGSSFEIKFKIKIEWAEVVVRNQFITIIDAGAPPYPSIALPKNTPLDKEEIKKALSIKAYSSYMYKIKPDTHLKFRNKNSAIIALRRKTGFDQLKPGSVALGPEILSSQLFPTFSQEGQLVYVASGEIGNNQNKCITAQMNLVSGDFISYERDCRVWAR